VAEAYLKGFKPERAAAAGAEIDMLRTSLQAAQEAAAAAQVEVKAAREALQQEAWLGALRAALVDTTMSEVSTAMVSQEGF